MNITTKSAVYDLFATNLARHVNLSSHTTQWLSDWIRGGNPTELPFCAPSQTVSTEKNFEVIVDSLSGRFWIIDKIFVANGGKYDDSITILKNGVEVVVGIPSFVSSIMLMMHYVRLYIHEEEKYYSRFVDGDYSSQLVDEAFEEFWYLSDRVEKFTLLARAYSYLQMFGYTVPMWYLKQSVLCDNPFENAHLYKGPILVDDDLLAHFMDVPYPEIEGESTVDEFEWPRNLSTDMEFTKPPETGRSVKRKFEAEMGDYCNLPTANLSNINKMSYRKICMSKGNRVFVDLPKKSKNLIENKKFSQKKSKQICSCLKHVNTIRKSNLHNFEAEMFSRLAVPHKLSDEQFQSIESLCSRFIEQIEATNSKLDGITQNHVKSAGINFGIGVTAGVGKKIGDTMSSIISYIESVMSDANVTIIVAALLLFYLRKKASTKSFFLVLGLMVAALAYLNKQEIINAIKASFSSLFRQEIEVTFENIEEIINGFQAEMLDTSILTDSIVLFLGYMYAPETLSDKGKLLKYIGDIGRSHGGTETIVNSIVRITQKILDYASLYIGFESFNLVTSYIPQVDSWIKDTRNAINGIHKSKFGHTIAMYDGLVALEDRAFELLSKYGNDRKAFGVSSMIRPVLGELQRVRLFLEVEGVGQAKTRQAPVIVNFSGGSQIGKSRMMRPFVCSLLAMVLPPDQLELAMKDVDSQVYSAQPELKYDDGYCGQIVCFLDEKDLVHTDLLTAENANSRLVRWGNVFPAMMHMAGIEQKGSVYFRSKFIICTTNIEKTMTAAEDSVKYPEAVANRIHFDIAVRVKQEYATPETQKLESKYYELDKSKMPPGGRFERDIHDYVLLGRRHIEGVPGQKEYYDKETIGYDELLRRVAEVYKTKEMESQQTPADDLRAFDHGVKLRMQAEMDDAFPSEDPEFFEVMNMLTLWDGKNKYSMMGIVDNYRNLTPEIIDAPDEFIVSVASEHLPEGGHRHDFVRRFGGSRAQAFRYFFEDMKENAMAFFEAIPCYDQFQVEYDSFFGKVALKFEYIKSAFAKICIKFEQSVQKYFPRFSLDVLKSILTGAATAALVYYVAKAIMDRFFSSESECVEYPSQGSMSFARTTTEATKRREEYVQKTKTGSFKAEYSDTCMIDVYEKIWNNNYYAMSYESGSEPFGYGFFLAGNTFVFCSHYVNIFKARGYTEYDIYLKNDKREICVPIATLLESKDVGRDTALCTIKHTVLHPNISHLLVDPQIFIKRGFGEAMAVRKIGKTHVPTMVKFKVAYNMTYPDGAGKEYKQPISIIYEATTAKGHCGLPLFINDPTTRAQKFIGFHVAGDGKSGMSNIFDVPKEFEAEASYIPNTMEIVGSVSRAPHNSGESMIRRSPLFEAWGPALKAPAHLRSFTNSEGEKVSPMLRAIARYDKPILKYDQDLVDACARAALAANTQYFKEVPMKITMEEAICGIPGVDYMEGLNRSTSPGYPWNMNHRAGFSGKERFLGKNMDIDCSGPDYEELVKQVEEAHEMLRAGKRPMFYFSDSLKDETIKKEKVYRGDTRLFCPSPIVYQILNRMYFGDFHRRFMEVRIQGEHTVGINVYSSEWDMLARKHNSFGAKNVVAGDFKSFDASQSAQILKAIGEFMIESFGDREFDSIRRLLWMNVYDSHHIFGKDIVRWCQSLPSGDPGTTNINCLFVGTIMRMCFVKVNGDDIGALRQFSVHTKLSANGDDHLLTITDKYLSIFNQNTITTAMADFGLTYTSEDKDDLNPPPSRPITEVTFLKRSFRYEPFYGRYCAPLKLETILEMPYWSKKKFYDTIWRDNLENAVREMSLHEPEVFNKWVPKMCDASYRLTQYVPEIVNRKALLDEIVKKEIKYKAEINDMISPSRNAPLRTGWDKAKILNQMIVPDTALGVKPSSEKRFVLTKMGLSKEIYLGRIQCVESGGVARSIRDRLPNPDNNLMNTEIDQSNDMAGTTQILNEAGVKTVTREHLSDIPGGLLKATQVGYDQSSIYDFFKKPVRLSTFEWNSQSAGSVLYNSSLPQDVFSQAVYRDKLRGFYGFRGTMVIRVQVNGTKFQSGRLLLVFIPQGNVANSYPGMRLRSLKAATQLPRVELDIGSETEIVMEVPYVSPTPYYNLATSEGPYGRAVLLVYEPLATGTGSAVADVTMWVHFKDVDMVTPTFTAEMGERKPKKRPIKNPSEQELGEMTNGSISGGLTMMAKAASSFAKVPLLTNLAGPASWALNCMAGVASAFGYSKPTSEEAMVKVAQTFSHNLQNHNGVDIFPNMGLDASNKMSIMPGFAGTDVDEMSLNHLLQVPAYVTRFAWNTSQGADTLLLNVVPSPDLYRSSAVYPNFWTGWDLTPLDYFSSLFYYWRGSFVVTLKFVKTQYHSGRVLIAWSPSGDPSLDQTAFVLREIVDLRETSEFRFVIPYVATSQYLPTSDLDESIGGMGRLKIFVLNELVCPASVSSTVGVLVEYAAGPDFEVMCPRPFNRCPLVVNTWAAQMGDVVPASSSSSRPDRNQELVGVGSAQIEDQSLDPALYCVGERCNSILQLLKRYCRLRIAYLGTECFGIDFRPFTVGACYTLDPLGLPTTLTGDYLTLFSYCFAYVRGSVRILAARNEFGTGEKSNGAVCVYPSSDDVVFRDLMDPLTYSGISLNFQPGFNGSGTGCSIPPYQRLHARLNRVSSSGNVEPIDVYGTAMRCCINVASSGEASLQRLYRAAGDDFTLGYFLGVPLVTTNVSNA